MSKSLESKLRIVQVLAPARFGGLERVVQLLSTRLASHGHEVHVVAVLGQADADHPFLDALSESSVQIMPLRLASRAYRKERDAIRALCQRVRPHVVHTHGYRPDVVDAGVARRLDIPTVTTVHGNTGGDWKNRLYERLQRWSYRKFDAVVAVAQPLFDTLLGERIASDRLFLIRNAWPSDATILDAMAARERLGVAADRFHIGWVGRLTAEKGPDIFIEALGRLKDLPFTASILGDGDQRTVLEGGATELGLADKVRFQGLIENAGSYLGAFDVFVLSSRTEGTPIALFEAMAAGVPIVATRVGGVPDVLTADGALLAGSEDPQSLAEAIRVVFSDTDEAVKRAEASRERLKTEFAPEPWVREYESLYRHLVRPES